MIVTKTTKTIYRVELSEQQRTNLLLLLESMSRNNRQVIEIQSERGKEVADEVAETCNDLLASL